MLHRCRWIQLHRISPSSLVLSGGQISLPWADLDARDVGPLGLLLSAQQGVLAHIDIWPSPSTHGPWPHRKISELGHAAPSVSFQAKRGGHGGGRRPCNPRPFSFPIQISRSYSYPVIGVQPVREVTVHAPRRFVHRRFCTPRPPTRWEAARPSTSAAGADRPKARTPSPVSTVVRATQPSRILLLLLLRLCLCLCP